MFSVNFKMASRSYTCSKKIIIMVKCTLWTPHSVHITLIIIFFIIRSRYTYQEQKSIFVN